MPDGLRRKISQVALPIRDALLKAGWTFGIIHWHNQHQRTLSFTVVSPSGKSGYVACDEASLVRNLEQLLNSN